jgi:hypothetical protein
MQLEFFNKNLMEKLVDDFRAIYKKTQDVKELYELMMDWVNVRIDIDEETRQNIHQLLKSYVVQNNYIKSKEYLEYLRGEVEAVSKRAARAEQEACSQRDLLRVYEETLNMKISLLKEEVDENTDIEIRKYLVDFNTHSKLRSTHDEAIDEITEISHNFKLGQHSYSLTSSEDILKLRRALTDKVFEHK